MKLARGRRRARRRLTVPLLLASAGLMVAGLTVPAPLDSGALLTASDTTANVYSTGAVGPARSVTFTKSGANAVVSWLAPASGVPVTGYYVETARASAGPWTRVATTTGASTTFTHVNAPSGTIYYRVIAYRSNWVPGPAASPGGVVTPLAAPTNLAAASNGGHATQTRVTWSPVVDAGVSSYYIYRTQCDFWGNGCGTVLRYQVPLTNGNVGQQAHIFSDQVAGRSYWYKAAAGDASNVAGTPTHDITSAGTGVISHTIPTNPSPAGAQRLEVTFVRTNANNKWASEMWSERIVHHNQSTADSGLSNYQRRERVPGGAWGAWANLKSNGPTLPGLRQAWTWWPLGYRMNTDVQFQAPSQVDAAKEYQVRGQACNPSGCSAWVESAVYTLPLWAAARQFMPGGVWNRSGNVAGGHQAGSFHYRLDRWVDGKGPSTLEKGEDSDFANWPVQVANKGDITTGHCPAFNATCSHTQARSTFIGGLYPDSNIFRSYFAGPPRADMVGVHSFYYKRDGAWQDNRWLISAAGAGNSLNPELEGSFGLRTGTDPSGMKGLFWASIHNQSLNVEPLKMASDTNWHHYLLVILEAYEGAPFVMLMEDGEFVSHPLAFTYINVHPAANIYLGGAVGATRYGARGYYDEWMYFPGNPGTSDTDAHTPPSGSFDSISSHLWHLRGRQ